MDKRLIIIHQSDIIRKGIWAILRETFRHEFILLNNISRLDDYSGFSNTNLYIFIQDELINKSSDKFINDTFESSNNIYLIPILNDIAIKSDKNIHINEDANDIISKIKKLTEANEELSSQLSELSVREKDVLTQVAMGLSNKEIADKLFISIHTVITHRKHITDKLGIKSISGLTVYAILNKLINTDNIDPASLI